jgi:hypothetical protein
MVFSLVHSVTEPLVARMERSLIRDRLTPDYAALHPGYKGQWVHANSTLSGE